MDNNVIILGSMNRGEKYLERQIVMLCDRLGFECIKNTCGDGFPDRTIYASNGRTIIIEFKSFDGRLSGSQKYKVQRLRELGHIILLVKDDITLQIAIDIILE